MTNAEIAAIFDANGKEVARMRILETMMVQNYEEVDLSIKGLLLRANKTPQQETKTPGKELTPKTVVFNPPATVVLWQDGTRTIVKCDNRDEYIPLIGLALCYMKKSLGNTSRELNNALRNAEKEIEKWEERK